MDCRGAVTRELIVNEYVVTPIIHAKLLNGQTKRSDASALIMDRYYIFECVHRTTKAKEIIQCGMGAARHLLELTNQKPLHLFNMLKDEGLTGNGKATSEKQKQWNPVAKQLYHAIMILIVDWDAKPNTPLFDIKKKAEKYYYCEPFLDRIKQVNNIIAKDSKNRTITQILDDLRSSGNHVKDYHFQLLTNILIKEGIVSNF